MASILVPFAYLIIVFGSLIVFSYFYKKHTSTRVYEPYFPSHPERNAYVTLLQQTDPPASDSLLKSALVRRAMADVQRVLRIREDKPALQALLQKGSIGDELWNSITAAEKELEAEILEVISEANTFVEGWGQVIFPTANEMIANEKMRATFERTAEAKAELETRYEYKSQVKSLAPPGTPSKLTGNGLLSPSTPGQGPESQPTSDAESSTPKSAKGKPRRK